MQKELIPELLRSHGLRVTAVRLRLLEAFLKRNSAIGSAELEAQFSGVHDRSSLFRTLNAFVRAGILHPVVTENRNTLYALCGKDCVAGRHSDDHAHFTCTCCARVICLPQVKIPKIKGLPEGYFVESSRISLTGLCDTCRQRSSHGKKSG